LSLVHKVEKLKNYSFDFRSVIFKTIRPRVYLTCTRNRILNNSALRRGRNDGESACLVTYVYSYNNIYIMIWSRITLQLRIITTMWKLGEKIRKKLTSVDGQISGKNLRRAGDRSGFARTGAACDFRPDANDSSIMNAPRRNNFAAACVLLCPTT